MKLSKNFTLEEFIKSPTAARYGIPNKPNADQMLNIEKLVKTVLQPIRTAWRKPIVVSSGFRSPLLNRIVRGAKRSDHLFGAAADIHTVSDTKEENKQLFDLVVQMINEHKIEVRQLIDEKNYNWIHVSINNSMNLPRNNQILHL